MYSQHCVNRLICDRVFMSTVYGGYSSTVGERNVLVWYAAEKVLCRDMYATGRCPELIVPPPPSPLFLASPGIPSHLPLPPRLQT
jgi:hypothetical protein